MHTASRRSQGFRLVLLILLGAALGWQPAAQAQRPPADRTFAPPPGSKNASVQPAADPAGVTRSGPAPAGSKNAPAPEDDSTLAPADVSISAQLMSCTSFTDGGWSTTSAAFATVNSCSLTVSEPGVVYLNGSASLGLGGGGAYEARLNVAVDAATGNAATDRWVNISADSGDGTDKSAAATLITSVTSGTHTFYLLAALYSGAGPVQLYDPSLSVLYLPQSSARVKTCGVSNNANWDTADTAFTAIRSCALTINQPGYVYLSGTASVGYFNGAVEGTFRVGIDSVAGNAASNRWVNTYANGDDGVDESVSASLITSVTTGTHTFYFSGARYAGAGTVRIHDPTLAVFYFPEPNVTAKVCGALQPGSWTNATESYTVISSCAVSVPRTTLVFVDANGSAGSGGEANGWEGQFRIGVDNQSGSSRFDRWVNVEPDDGDGSDRTISNTGMVQVTGGPHTFYFVGKRYAGAGTPRLYTSSLSILVPGGRFFAPLVQR